MSVHTHFGLPCRFGTQKACDVNHTQFLHGHLGRPCVKEYQESKTRRGQPNKVATCTLITQPEHGQSFDALLKAAFAQAPREWHSKLALWEAKVRKEVQDASSR